MFVPLNFPRGGGTYCDVTTQSTPKRHRTINDVSPRRWQRVRIDLCCRRMARNDRARNIIRYCYISRTVTGLGRKRISLDLYYCSPNMRVSLYCYVLSVWTSVVTRHPVGRFTDALSPVLYVFIAEYHKAQWRECASVKGGLGRSVNTPDVLKQKKKKKFNK